MTYRGYEFIIHIKKPGSSEMVFTMQHLLGKDLHIQIETAICERVCPDAVQQRARQRHLK